jgi:nitroreductase
LHRVPVGADAPIFDVLKSMRAMRRLRPDPVPQEMLDQLIEAAI